MFAGMLGVLEAAARLGDNATVGCIQKMNLHLTVGQVGRLLKSLEKDGYLKAELRPYGATGKRVYMPTQLCATNVFIVSKAIDEALEAPAVEAIAS